MFFEVRQFTKSFGSVSVLREIDFGLEQGKVLCIIGSSGSGKTTLLRCMNFLETPDTGEMYISGEKIYDAAADRNLNDAMLRRKRLHFGLVFQQFNLFPQYTVLENVTLAPKLAAKERPDYKAGKKNILAELDASGMALLDSVGLLEKANAYPCELSGGQQQRVAIARALALKPEILCFDEPTSALDPELTGEVLRVIKGLKGQDRTMIVVTHEMEFARHVSDTVLFMADGVIEEIGAPEEIFGCPKSEKTKAFLQHSLEKI